MKRVFLLLTILITLSLPLGLFTMLQQAHAQVFKELAGCPGVESVTIGKFAMKIAKGMVTSKHNFIPKDGIKSLEGMEVISADSKEAKENVRSVLAKIIEEGKYEPLIESKESYESSSIYTILPAEGENEDICHNILVVTESRWEIEVVLIKGTFDINRIAKNAVSGELEPQFPGQ